MKPYSNYFVGLFIAIYIVLLGLSIFNIISNSDETTNYISEDRLLEYMSEFDKTWQKNRAEEKISLQVFEDLEQENANLKMTVTTFESLIATLDADNKKFSAANEKLSADNEKLSEIIQKKSGDIGGWGLFFLLVLIACLSGGMVIFLQQLTQPY